MKCARTINEQFEVRSRRWDGTCTHLAQLDPRKFKVKML